MAMLSARRGIRSRARTLPRRGIMSARRSEWLQHTTQGRHEDSKPTKHNRHNYDEVGEQIRPLQVATTMQTLERSPVEKRMPQPPRQRRHAPLTSRAPPTTMLLVQPRGPQRPRQPRNGISVGSRVSSHDTVMPANKETHQEKQAEHSHDTTKRTTVRMYEYLFATMGFTRGASRKRSLSSSTKA